MLKSELDRVVRGFDRAIAESLLRIRTLETGNRCDVCYALVGEQHREHCAVWPLILARAELRQAEGAHDDRLA